jgi:hypothetical protein
MCVYIKYVGYQEKKKENQIKSINIIYTIRYYTPSCLISAIKRKEGSY